MTPAAKRYTIQLLGLMATYTVLLFFSILELKRIPTSGLRVLVAVLPAVPLLLVVWAVIHFVRTLDELQKAIHQEAVTFALLATAALTLTYGFLENAGLPTISVVYVPVLMCFLWGIGTAVASRKYR